MNPKKLIFATLFIIAPLVYFIGYLAIQFLRGNSLTEAATTILSIIAIHLFAMSIAWLAGEEKVEKAVESDRKKMNMNTDKST